MMQGPINTSPGLRLPVGPSRCMGCAAWMAGKHQCGGDKIPAQGMGWWCDCAEPECRRRQQGTWPANAAGRKPRGRPRKT